VFDQLGGFYHGRVLVVEDTELACRAGRAGIRIHYAPEMIVQHHRTRRHFSITGLVRQNHWWGRTLPFLEPPALKPAQYARWLSRKAICESLLVSVFLFGGKTMDALRQLCQLTFHIGVLHSIVAGTLNRKDRNWALETSEARGAQVAQLER
jgi:hypothetical protein